MTHRLDMGLHGQEIEIAKRRTTSAAVVFLLFNVAAPYVRQQRAQRYLLR